MTQNSACVAIQQNIADLATSIAVCCEPRMFFDLLVEKNLVPYLSSVEIIDVQGISNHCKVSRLLSLVAVEPDAKENIFKLMDIVRDLGPSPTCIADKVLQDYRSLAQVCPNEETAISASNTKASCNKQKVRDNCATREAYKELEYQYSICILSIEKLFKQEKIPLSDLKTMWSHICNKKKHHKALRSKTIRDFVRIVSHDGRLPSLQYRSLEKLVVHFSPINGAKLIKDYKKKIKKYLKSQVSCGVQQLRVKVNLSFDKYDDILDLRTTLGKLFKFCPEEVALVSAEEGSIVLTYLVLSSVGVSINAWKFKEEDSDVLQKANIELISVEGQTVWDSAAQRDLSVGVIQPKPDMLTLTKSSSKDGRTRSYSGKRLVFRGDHEIPKVRSQKKCETIRQLLVTTCTILLLAVGVTFTAVADTIPTQWTRIGVGRWTMRIPF
ncbi:uncharacterized protein LOC135335817 isoform X3 [Halichondria panicea]|uniref:uncharacterized protein LOC135335817 isoform X3 n=1 Tax=Halichondria panicea TaxID=6063 RepID=UPI00312B346F